MRLLLLLLAMLFVAEPILAEEANETFAEDLFDMSLEELMDTEVVSSGRRRQEIGRATSAMYVINAEDIRTFGNTFTLTDILRLVPGMEVISYKPRRNAIGSRGLAQGSNKRMQVFIDGMPLYDPLSGGALIDMFPMFVDNIERVEVIRGSGGVTWGVNALNGVINIITKKASKTQGGTAYGMVGNRQNMDGFLRYGGTNGKMSWRGTTGAYNSNGWGGAGGEHIKDFFHGFKATGRADFELKDNTKLSFSGGHSFSKDATVNRRDSIQFMNIIWNRQYDDGSALMIRGSQNYYLRKKEANGYHDDTHASMLELQHNLSFDKHSLVWGGEVTREKFIVSGDDNDIKHHDRSVEGLSGYIEDEIELKDNLWLTIGTRQYYSEITHYDWAGRAALIWEAAPKHFFRVAASRSFRRPTLREKFTYKTNTVVDKTYKHDPPQYKNNGNPKVDKTTVTYQNKGSDNNIHNEHLNSFEIGYRGQLADNLELNIEGFLNLHRGLIGQQDIFAFQTTRLFDINGDPYNDKTKYTNTYVNARDLQTYGLETAVKWQPFDWWLVKGSHTYTHQTDENSLRFKESTGGTIQTSSIPAHKVALTNRFYLDEDTTLNTNLFWSDTFFYKKNDDELIKVDPYCRLDMRLSKQIWKDSAEIAVGVTNLLEQFHLEGGDPGEEVPRIVYFQFFISF